MSSQAEVRIQPPGVAVDRDHGRSFLATAMNPGRSLVGAIDVSVFALILLFGALGFFFYQHSADFTGEDVFYADCARSLLHHGFYGINGRPETNQPPGLPAMLAFLFAMFGDSHAVSLRAMAIFEALGFLAAYEILRHRLPMIVAAGICILMLSSPLYFSMSTGWVFPTFPFFFTTMVALLLLEKYQTTSTPASTIAYGVLLAFLIAVSIMFATAGVALLGAIVAVGCATLLAVGHLDLAKVRRWLPILLVGIAIQLLWMHRTPAPLEWPLPGYPAPYLQQLKVKFGNYPELGMATLGDLGPRVWANATAQADLFGELLLRHGISASKTFTVIIPILMISIGWVYSVWQKKGRDFVEWYFAGYELIYLLWPWRTEIRFLLPIAPLAGVYVWQGIKGARVVVTRAPRIAGAIGSPLCLILGISGVHWTYTHWGVDLGRYPDELIAVVWLILSFVAAKMAYTGRPPSFLMPDSALNRWARRPLTFPRVVPLRVGIYAACVFVLALLANGILKEAGIARENLGYRDLVRGGDTHLVALPLEMEAAQWIRSHTPSNAIVMARHVPIVYHYSDRKLVWFPPSSNADILMQGIVKHHVGFIIVIKHKLPYYMPDDDYCFHSLLAKYPTGFRIVFQDSGLQIVEVQG
jgi:hypothetical protein